MQEVSPTPVSLLEELHTKFGKQLVEKIREIWTAEALPQANSRLLKYFLSRKESSPQTLKGTEREDSSEEHMFEMVCKMVLYHPDVWYEVVSGMELPTEMKPDFNARFYFRVSKCLMRSYLYGFKASVE